MAFGLAISLGSFLDPQTFASGLRGKRERSSCGSISAPKNASRVLPTACDSIRAPHHRISPQPTFRALPYARQGVAMFQRQQYARVPHWAAFRLQLRGIRSRGADNNRTGFLGHVAPPAFDKLRLNRITLIRRRLACHAWRQYWTGQQPMREQPAVIPKLGAGDAQIRPMPGLTFKSTGRILPKMVEFRPKLIILLPTSLGH